MYIQLKLFTVHMALIFTIDSATDDSRNNADSTTSWSETSTLDNGAANRTQSNPGWNNSESTELTTSQFNVTFQNVSKMKSFTEFIHESNMTNFKDAENKERNNSSSWIHETTSSEHLDGLHLLSSYDETQTVLIDNG